MASTPRDENHVPGLIAKSDADSTPVIVEADPVTKRLKVNTTITGTTIPVAGASTGVPVAIVDGSGNQITSFGGGTQYANGAVQATPTGTVALGWDGANVRVVAIDTGGKLNVNASLAAETTKVIGVARTADGSGNLLTSTGNALDINIKSGNPTSITANAGTNLNTSALALDATLTGGTQQSKITDGTNLANVLKSDGTVAGENSQLVAPAVRTIAFTTSSSGVQTILANTDVSHYAWIEVVYTSVGSGLALTGQFSTVSGGTYVNQSTFASNTGSPNGALGTTVSTVYTSPIRGNFFQIAVSALTSGTFTGTVTLRATPQPFITALASSSQSGTWTVGSNSATGSAVPANAFSIGAKALTASPTAATTGNLVALTADTMGELLTTTGGLVTSSVPANASNVVVKATPGRLCRVLVTATGANPMQIFDNATTNSGTIIGALPASPAIGTVLDAEMPAANGITIAGSATNPAVTVSWI